MLVPIALALGLLAQTAASSRQGDQRSGDPGVRIWVSDTLYRVGAGARVYVKLREPGYLLVLHTDATGRIQVLYPLAPQHQTVVPAGDPLEVTGADDRATFSIEIRGRGTLLAVRAPRPFQFDALRRGNRWDYEQSLLLQPTAGNPFAALLDIADRAADGSPYDYDVTAYGTPGSVAARAASDTVCFSCLTARHPRTPASGTAGYGEGAVAIDHSYAAAGGSSVVDCSGANLVDSFCGIQDNSVTNTYTDNSTYQSSSTTYPVYVPVYIPFRLIARPTPPAPAPPPPAITLPLRLRPVSRRLVPPPRRPRPQIVVVQPTAPSHPQLSSDQPESVVEENAAQPLPPRVIRPVPMAAPNTVSGMQRGVMWSESMGRTGATSMSPASGPAAAITIARPMLAAPRAFVPSRAVLRSLNARR